MSGRIPPVGTLRHRVQLQQKIMSTEPAGGHATTYVPIATVWASISSKSGGDYRGADSRGAKISHVVMLRFRNDLTVGDRILYGGRSLEILFVKDLNGRKAYLECACQEMLVTG